MKTTLQQWLTGLGCCWALAYLPGCMPFNGPRTAPGWPPGQPIGIPGPQPYPGSQPYPGGSPWQPIGYPRFPAFPGNPGMFTGGPGIPIGGPGIPIVMLPGPNPGTGPLPPGLPFPNPGTPPVNPPVPPPTIPVVSPKPAPTVPQEDSNEFWSPWPLPPRGGQLAIRGAGFSGDETSETPAFRRSGQRGVSRPPFDQLVSSAADGNLKYRGGRIIRDLYYVNLYVSADTQWSMSDVEQIDRSLSAAMQDQNLNNVLLQYFNNQSIRSTALPSHPLIGYTPKTVSRGDIQNYLTYLHRQGFLRSFDLTNTVFNLLLPPGTVLTSDNTAADSQQSSANTQTFNARTSITCQSATESDDSNSRAGLGGYHGSVVTESDERIYFAVSVYSQRYANGAVNGIPVFGEPWKNVAATLYHQLMEVRTNPDVEDAIRNSSDLDSDRILGWVTDDGLEIGDIPLRTNTPISSVIREVPLSDGSGTVPVQLPYSNHTGGPEGPISQPHTLRLQ